jgi:hypothetical protein
MTFCPIVPRDSSRAIDRASCSIPRVKTFVGSLCASDRLKHEIDRRPAAHQLHHGCHMRQDTRLGRNLKPVMISSSNPSRLRQLLTLSMAGLIPITASVGPRIPRERFPFKMRSDHTGKQQDLANRQGREQQFEHRRLTHSRQVQQREAEIGANRERDDRETRQGGVNVGADGHRNRRRREDKLGQLRKTGEIAGKWPQSAQAIDEAAAGTGNGTRQFGITENECHVHERNQDECAEHPSRASRGQPQIPAEIVSGDDISNTQPPEHDWPERLLKLV